MYTESCVKEKLQHNNNNKVEFCVSLYPRTSVLRTSSGPHSAHLCSYNLGDPALKNKQRLFSSTSLKNLEMTKTEDYTNSSDRIYGEELSW